MPVAADFRRRRLASSPAPSRAARFVAKELVSQEPGTYFTRATTRATSTTAFPASLSFCSRTIAHAGTVQVDIEVGSDGRVTGEGGVEGTTQMVSFSGGNLCAINSRNTQPHGCCTPAPAVQGTASSFTFSGSHGNANVTVTYDFAGSLNGDVVTGNFDAYGRWGRHWGRPGQSRRLSRDAAETVAVDDKPDAP